MEKFNEEGITVDVIPSLRFIDKAWDIEIVVEAENNTASPVMKGNSQSYVCPVCSKIDKTELHYVKHISKCHKSISAGESIKFTESIQLCLKI